MGMWLKLTLKQLDSTVFVWVSEKHVTLGAGILSVRMCLQGFALRLLYLVSLRDAGGALSE